MAKKKISTESKDSSRRSFIKNTSFAAASFMIAPRFVLGGNGYTAQVIGL